MQKRINAQTAATMVAAATLLAGCSMLGIGGKSAPAPKDDVHATASWTAKDSRSGTMTAQVSSGGTYTGVYFQIGHDTQVADLDPLWRGWDGPMSRSWWGWGPWAGWGSPTFVASYNGKVAANLEGPNGTHMRCRFDLAQPASGLAGGGQGSCELPGGKTIDASLTRS